MMFPYLTFADETEVTHSQVLMRNERQEIEVHFERATEDGFDEARCVLPSYEWIHRVGYSDDEIAFFVEFLQKNVHLLFQYAQEDGLNIA